MAHLLETDRCAMNGPDWLWVVVLLGVLTLCWCLDAIVRADRRRIERDEEAASQRRLHRELRRHQ